MKITSISEARDRYGDINNNIWTNEKKWMMVMKMPNWFQNQIINSLTKQLCGKIYLNKDMQEPLLEALENLKNRKLIHELKTFDGCFSIRTVRGYTNVVSTHSYGLAINFNASENPLGQLPVFSQDFVTCFEKAGFTWRGYFKRPDGMHFSYAWE